MSTPIPLDISTNNASAASTPQLLGTGNDSAAIISKTKTNNAATVDPIWKAMSCI